MSGQQLDERDLEVLAFERQWWKYAGAKETAVREKFGMSSTRYYQMLNALIDHPGALAQDPLLVGRLQRLRDARRGQRCPERRPALASHLLGLTETMPASART